MLTASTMPRTARGVGMNKSKKKKQVPIEPLHEPPNPMSLCEPAAPLVETFEERVLWATQSMSPEKTRVVRLCIESDVRDKWCASIRECQRHSYKEASAWKRKMRADRAAQNLVPKARTKKELAQRKADEEKLAAARKRYHDFGHEWRINDAFRKDKIDRWAHAKMVRLERLLRGAGGEWCVRLRYKYLGFVVFHPVTFRCRSSVGPG